MEVSLHYRAVRRSGIRIDLFAVSSDTWIADHGNGVFGWKGIKKRVALSFDRLEPLGTKWHWYKWFGMAGNYLLMMFYTTIGGWSLLYFVKMAREILKAWMRRESKTSLAS